MVPAERAARMIYEILDGAINPTMVMAKARVLVTTHGTYDWLDEQFRAAGLDPRPAKFIVETNPMNHVMTYGDIATDVVVIASPGPTPATVWGLPFRHPISRTSATPSPRLANPQLFDR